MFYTNTTFMHNACCWTSLTPRFFYKIFNLFLFVKTFLFCLWKRFGFVWENVFVLELFLILIDNKHYKELNKKTKIKQKRNENKTFLIQFFCFLKCADIMSIFLSHRFRFLLILVYWFQILPIMQILCY